MQKNLNGEVELTRLMAGMEPVLDQDEYVFVTANAPSIDQMQAAIMSFRESEGVTLIVPKQWAENNNLTYAYPCRKITLNIHSSLDAIGFLAKITEGLASKNISVNVVSAFYHDHLFVEPSSADAAMVLLKSMATAAR